MSSTPLHRRVERASRLFLKLNYDLGPLVEDISKHLPTAVSAEFDREATLVVEQMEVAAEKYFALLRQHAKLKSTCSRRRPAGRPSGIYSLRPRARKR